MARSRRFMLPGAIACMLACALLAFSSGCAAWPTSPTGSAEVPVTDAVDLEGESARTVTSNQPVVTAEEVAALRDGAYLVDVRTPEEYAAGHIPGALNASYPISTGGPCQSGENSSAFRSSWERLNVPIDATVVVYCRAGVRAAAAASALVEDGYADVSVYRGSWSDWTSDPSRPVETS